MYRSLLLRLSIALTIVACLSAPASAGTILHTEFETDGGQSYLDLAGAYPSVGQFIGTDSGGGFAASGVLIDSNWVLTAAHVVDGATLLEYNLGGSQYTAESWIAHPNWNGNVSKGYDIGLVKFATNIADAQSVDPPTIYSGSVDNRVGTSVGFGTTGTGVTGWEPVKYSSQLQKRAGNNVIDAWYLPPGKPGTTPHIFLSDFDNPAFGSSYDDGNNFGGFDPIDLEYLIAPGDSGGGVFVGTELAGIHSFGWGRLDGDPNSDYDDVSGHTWVAFFEDWIKGVISPDGGGGGGGDDDGGGGGKPPWAGGPGGKNSSASMVPEPSTVWLLSMAALCLVGCWWRTRKG